MSRPRDTALSARDLERLRYAVGGDEIDPDRGLFADDGPSRRIHRELAIVLGGGRALLLQVAHPLVAAGVADHSDYRTNPLRRLWRTLDLMLTISFGAAAAAIGAVRTIERMHAPVHGRLAAAVGPFPRGTRYAARDPDLLFWVHATLVDTALLVYEMVVEDLPPERREAYYEESKRIARLFGIPEAKIPSAYEDFRRYMAGMLAGDVLAVGPASKAIAESIVSPPLPVGLKQIFQTPNLVTIGLLPPSLRERYGYSWGSAHEIALSIGVTGVQSLLAWLPERLRLWPRAREAAKGYESSAPGTRRGRGSTRRRRPSSKDISP